MDINLNYSGKNIDKYYLIQKLGNGGFGAVYRAFDTVLGVEKAVKILQVTNPREAYKLFSEAAIPYKCQHNHIVKINSGEVTNFDKEFVFIVDMELAKGVSVDSMLRNRYIPITDSLSIIKDILFAVEYSHLQGIIHRDIKPSNILMDNGIPKLSDFGLSTALGDVIIPWKWYVTHAAPETFENSSVATIETDIYALGMTMYRMVNNISDWELFLSGIPNAGKLIKTGNIVNKIPISPVVPDKVYKIIKKACNPTPEKRYHRASEMRNAIERLNPFYRWLFVDENYWRGEALGNVRKEIYIESKRNSLSVIVCNNGRKSTADSRNFSDMWDARAYMFSYIKQTTLH